MAWSQTISQVRNTKAPLGWSLVFFALNDQEVFLGMVFHNSPLNIWRAKSCMMQA